MKFPVLSFAVFATLVAPVYSEPGTDAVLKAIGQLEDKRDPKCYATASRLEDFMYGTPLSEEARFHKIDLQKQLIFSIWTQASRLAQQQGSLDVKASQIQATYQLSGWQDGEQGGGSFNALNGQKIELKPDDLRQYGTVAYALRAILSVQQDLLLSPQASLLPLSDDAVAELKQNIDRLTLAALQLSDHQARMENRRSVTKADLDMAWQKLVPQELAAASLPSAELATEAKPGDTLRAIIAQKISSFEAYNNISTPVFMRNIQVYFARYRWPENPEHSNELKALFNETLIAFSRDLYLASQQNAQREGHSLMRIQDVQEAVIQAIPHKMNQYEDAIFFPALPRAEQVEIEAYDMDAFRDAGLHWRYLATVLDESAKDIKLEPDPFAAELLVENIAQFGVLLLRLAGEEAAKAQAPALDAQYLVAAGRVLTEKIKKNFAAQKNLASNQTVASAADTVSGTDVVRYFSEITDYTGINFKHSLSDWLSRLIRSYTVRDQDIAVLAVPPAFGGSGIAAEDVNADGRIDVLLLGGYGNKLYLNQGQGKFIDATAESGLDWRRADSKAGEPRQPLIADFDNDGKPDIFISYVNDAHRLYRNLGNGHFEDVTAQAGLGGENLVGGPAVTADFDNDGLLDISIGYFGQYIEGIKPTLARRNTNGLPNKMFRNLGGFKFEDVTERSGTANTGWAQAMTHTDFDRDGWQDLIIGNDFGVNAWYRNQGDGTFKDVATQLGVDKPSYTMGLGVADLNNDLFPDVYVSNIVTMDKDQKYVLPDNDMPMKFDAAKMAHMRVVESNDLFLSESRDGRLNSYLMSDLMGRGASSTGWAWGASFIDTDNDGDQDLYVVNGMNAYAIYSAENPYYQDPKGWDRNVVFPQSGKESNVFFLNSGGAMHNVSERSGLDFVSNSRAAVYFDIDGDGDLDVVVNNLNDSARVFANNAELLNNHWMKIRLIGDAKAKSNRDAIGARLILTTKDGKRMWREIRGGESYLTSMPKEQHFGLGKETSAKASIEWPNGERQELGELQSGFVYVIDQASKSIGRKTLGK